MTCPHNYNYDTCLACVLWELEMQKSIRDWTRNFIMAEALKFPKIKNRLVNINKGKEGNKC